MMEKIKLDYCPYEHQDGTPEEELDALAKEIRKLQDDCNEYVAEQTLEQIKELLLTNINEKLFFR